MDIESRLAAIEAQMKTWRRIALLCIPCAIAVVVMGASQPTVMDSIVCRRLSIKGEDGRDRIHLSVSKEGDARISLYGAGAWCTTLLQSRKDAGGSLTLYGSPDDQFVPRASMKLDTDGPSVQLFDTFGRSAFKVEANGPRR